MEHGTWHPLSGGAQFYPLVKGTTLLTSNAFVVRMPGLIAVVDPGNDAGQIAALRRLLAGAADQPLLVLLTHCHADHGSLADPAGLVPGRRVPVAIQEEGRQALQRKDRELTGAGRYRQMIPETLPEISLLSADDRRNGSSRRLALDAGWALDLATRAITMPGGGTLYVQELSGAGFRMQAYYTPGHSPDSVAFRVGNLLLTGDALLAAEHFVAGLPGWDQHDALATAENMLWLVNSGGVATVAPGHGSILTAALAAGKLQNMIAKLATMQIQKVFTVPTILAASEHARDVAREAQDIMATLADALNQAARYLDLLDEEREARRYAAAINRKKFQDILAAFNAIAAAMQSGELLAMALVRDSSALFWKMRVMLKAVAAENIMNRSWLARWERLLDDFVNDAMGRPIQLQTATLPAAAWLRETVAAIQQDIHADESILNTLDDEQAFAQALGRRLVFRPTYRGVEITVAAADNLRLAADPGRLSECLEIMLEHLVAAGSRRIRISAAPAEPGMVALAVAGGNTGWLTDDYRQRALARRLRWLGGRFENQPDALLALVPAADQPTA